MKLVPADDLAPEQPVPQRRGQDVDEAADAAHRAMISALILSNRSSGGGMTTPSTMTVPSAAAAGTTVLVKGSRFMRMERVVAALCGSPAKEGAH